MVRAALWGFLALAALTLPAFWPSYFAVPIAKDALHVHFHGIAMFAWTALLVAQAALMRFGRREWHRALGKVSFVLVPVVVLSTLMLARLRAQQAPASEEIIYFLYVQLGLVAFFALCYAWAMANRRVPPLHMRYMAGTALAMVDPIVARLLAIYLGVMPPLMQAITYGLVLALLAAMAWRERARAPLAAAWRRMALAYALLMAPTFFVPQTAAWRAFVAWYGTLPLP